MHMRMCVKGYICTCVRLRASQKLTHMMLYVGKWLNEQMLEKNTDIYVQSYIQWCTTSIVCWNCLWMQNDEFKFLWQRLLQRICLFFSLLRVHTVGHINCRESRNYWTLICPITRPDKLLWISEFNGIYTILVFNQCYVFVSLVPRCKC